MTGIGEVGMQSGAENRGRGGVRSISTSIIMEATTGMDMFMVIRGQG